MEQANLISRTEACVREVMGRQSGDLMIAHDFKHVDRVRNWAMTIAAEEGFADFEMVEVAALLHDIGLGHVGHGGERKGHGSIGADVAERFLKENSILSGKQIEMIADAIRYHSLSPQTVAEHLCALGNEGNLTQILRDADNLDALGAVGVARAFTSKYFLPEYDPVNIKGDAWGLSSAEFRRRFGHDFKDRLSPVNTIIDQVNQQIRYHDSLHTGTAKRLAFPLVEFMRSFVLQLESEIGLPLQADGDR